MKIPTNKGKDIFIYLFLIFIPVFAYWPVSFLTNSLKWDMIDVVLPYRYFVGECIQNKIFPLWNPYLQMGYPIYADMQVPLWNPEVWIFGLLGGYSNYSLHFLFIVYVIIAGIGVYHLTKYLGGSRFSSVISAVAFMLSGFITGHGQAMFAIVAAAWIPYVFLFYLKLLKEKGITNIILVSIFMYLLITNGYQTFTIILSYTLALLFLFEVIKQMSEKDFSSIKSILINNFLFLLLTALLCLPSLLSTFQSLEFTDRSSGMPLSSVMINPLSPQSLISLFFPFSTVKNPEFFKTDMSMANVYFGLIMFVLFSLIVSLKKKPLHWILLFIALICLLASFGDYFPLRKLFYDYLPLMNLFRFPSYFSYFTLLIILVITGANINNIFELINQHRKKTIVILSGFILFLIAIIIYSAFHIQFSAFSFLSVASNFHETLAKSTFMEHLFIQGFLQLFILIIFLLMILKKRAMSKYFLSFLIVTEMFVSVQLNNFYTVVSHKKPIVLKEQFSHLPKGFPIPNFKINEYSDVKGSFPPVWRNTGVFHKEIQSDAFSSFWLNSYNCLFENHIKLKNAVLNNKLVYLSDNLFKNSKIDSSPDSMFNNKSLFISDSVYQSLNFENIKCNKGDSIWITSFNPNEIKVSVITLQLQIVTLLQSDYPGWQVYIDSRKSNHFTSNCMFISAVIPSGAHQLVFKYENPWIIRVFIFSSSFFVLLLLILMFNKRLKLNK